MNPGEAISKAAYWSTTNGPLLIAYAIVFTVLLALYFLPTVVAGLQHRRQLVAIFVLNLVAGWTFIGWVAALVWACIADSPRQRTA